MDELELKELSALFSLSRDAVLCVRGDLVVYANAAAAEYFPGCVGTPISRWLPELLLEDGEENFVCTLPRGNTVLSVSCVRRGDTLLLSLPRSERPQAVMPAAALAELRSTAYNLHMAAELMGNPGGNENSGTYAAILQHNYYRLLRLTRNLTDANTLATGELKIESRTQNLGKVYARLVDSVNFFAGDRGVTIDFACQGGCYVQGDRERLEQLLLNLLTNALLHTEKGGRIQVNLRCRGEQVILSVDDNGSGMTESALRALFAVREEAGILESGAGLGLYVCQGIVRAHGGTMLAESRADRGTKIRVMLPASKNTTLRDGDDLPYGSGLLLTELSPVLNHQRYDKRYRD